MESKSLDGNTGEWAATRKPTQLQLSVRIDLLAALPRECVWKSAQRATTRVETGRWQSSRFATVVVRDAKCKVSLKGSWGAEDGIVDRGGPASVDSDLVGKLGIVVEKKVKLGQRCRARK
jgi:hypothetical protein